MDDFTHGVLLSASVLIACHDAPVEAATILKELGMATADCSELDAGRYRWLREHFRFANDSMRELWFDPVLEPNDSGVPVDLDAEIDRAMNGANV